MKTPNNTKLTHNRGDDQLPAGTFRGDDQLPAGTFRGDDYRKLNSGYNDRANKQEEKFDKKKSNPSQADIVINSTKDKVGNILSK